MRPIAETIAAAAVCVLVFAAMTPKPAADASPVATVRPITLATVAPTVVPPPAPGESTEPAQPGAGFNKTPVATTPAGPDPVGAGGFTSLPGQPLRKVARVAAAPVRFVRQAAQRRQGLFAGRRTNGGRRFAVLPRNRR
jgi:hypothetical protein